MIWGVLSVGINVICKNFTQHLSVFSGENNIKAANSNLLICRLVTWLVPLRLVWYDMIWYKILYLSIILLSQRYVDWDCLKHLMDCCTAEINKYPRCLYERLCPWWLVCSNTVIFGSPSTPVSCSKLHQRIAARQKWPFPKQTTWGALIKRDYVLRVPLSFPGLVQWGESSAATGPPCFIRAVDGEEGGEWEVNEVLGTFSPKSFWYLGSR